MKTHKVAKTDDVVTTKTSDSLIILRKKFHFPNDPVMKGRISFRSKWLDIRTRDPPKSWELPIPLHVGAEDLLKMLKLSDVNTLHYEIYYLSRYVDEEYLLKVGVSTHVKDLELECMEEGFIKGFMKGIHLVHRKAGAEVDGLTPSQASRDSSSDSDGDEIESELKKTFILEDDTDIEIL
ncbi:hypothetical protein IEQ34_022285 [Dendrobium chrysotoxum]|uniref:Uncharacterized protein n=1 Tax=Dendrobium chrysotoxum TaxID=161865 RepID=A0AAV7FK23_DENCH|nr:hypothetical protein IEQ34_022285 [Dendrobium chrysotoxum]